MTSILADTTNHGRVYKNDARQLTGANSFVLPDNSIYLDTAGPVAIAAETWVINVIEARGGTIPAASDSDEYKWLYFACLYKAVCNMWNGIFNPEIIKEKAPDFEFQLNTEQLTLKRAEICASVETWFDKLDVPEEESVLLDTVRGDDRAEYNYRSNGI